jgi:SAM-dependent methyltransferase
MKILLRLINILESIYLRFDKRFIRRTNNIVYIPAIGDRRGGKRSYAEWAHVIGIFQSLFYFHLPRLEGNQILDIGSGTGLLSMAAMPYVYDGKYIGLDVGARDVDFSRRHYTIPGVEFHHLNMQNALYAPDQPVQHVVWPVPAATFDLVVALSVWTHMRPLDAAHYFKEIDRVLRPDCKAIITFFLLDADYQESLSKRRSQVGRFHRTSQSKWIFDQPHPESPYWFYPKWVKVPEDAMGITPEGLTSLLEGTALKLVQLYPGNWKEKPGLYFQDILVFQKKLGE